MAPETTHLNRFYEGWGNYQDLLVDAIGTLSSEQLALRAAPSLRPIWELAAHIIAARVWLDTQHYGGSGGTNGSRRRSDLG